MAVSVFAILLLTVAICTATPVSFDDWKIVGKPEPGHLVRLTFAVKQHNPDWLKDKLRAVSYPDSPQYTHYMNFDEIAKHVYGEPESVKAVTKALESMGAQKIDFTIGQDFIVAFVPFEKAEKVFRANFVHFEHSEEPGLELVSSLTYSVPSFLKKHIDFVSGLVLFPATQVKPVEKKPRYEGEELLGVTPDSIARDYNTSMYSSSNEGNSQAIAAFLKQYFEPSDLKKFQEKFKIPNKPIVKTVGEDGTHAGIEANLDVEYISATGRNVDTWFVSISTYSNGRQEDFLSWMVGQVNTTDSPWVHSASYGDDESSIDPTYLDRVNTEFMKFGVSGRTVLFASGDSGVDCGNRRKFTPSWPASSPYVTTVGGTTSLTTVWSSGGGGFSNHFTMPDYQKDVVNSYLSTAEDLPSDSKFNKSGRAYPDVSAFSTNFFIINDGFPEPVDGTSCAAPTFAGIVAILNDVRLNNGKKTLGFLNPLLYSTLKGNGFFDVTEGSNGDEFCKGFPAVKGWDAASGWGGPNFGVMKNLV